MRVKLGLKTSRLNDAEGYGYVQILSLQGLHGAVGKKCNPSCLKCCWKVPQGPFSNSEYIALYWRLYLKQQISLALH